MNNLKETILVIGNGFDLAHGLPTSYMDFIKFEQAIKELMKTQSSKNYDAVFGKHGVNTCIGELVEKHDNKALEEGKTNYLRDTWEDLLGYNYWIYHFENSKTIGEGWIDFEAEMTDVIKRIYKIVVDNDIDMEFNTIVLHEAGLYELADFIGELAKNKKITLWNYKNIKEIIDSLHKDLDKLRRALELYLYDYVSPLGLNNYLNVIEKIKPTKVISFNYTKTFERTYGQDLNGVEYTYIHGIADSRRKESDNDMVLGVDEFQTLDKDTNLLFVDFKKYYQRLAYNCSRDAEQWTDKIRNESIAESEAKRFFLDDGIKAFFTNDQDERYISWFRDEYLERYRRFDDIFGKNKIVFFGHSLGESDKYILRKLILNENIEVIVYFHNEKSHRDMVKNLIRVIGQEELMMRTGNRSLVFEHC